MVVLVKIVFGQQIQIGQKLLENKFTGEWELIKWDCLLKRDFLILFLYIFEIDDTQLACGIMCKYLI